MKKQIIAFAIAAILILQASGQFPWQSKDSIIPFAENSAALIQKINDIVQEYREKYPEMFYEFSRRAELLHKVSENVDGLMGRYKEILIPFMMSNPDISHTTVKTFLSFSLSLLEPLYVLAILFTSIYLLFLSNSPRGRMRAKATFVKLIIGLGIIMLTLPIIQLLVELSHSFASIVLSILQPNPEIFISPIKFFMAYFTVTTFFKPVAGSFLLLFSILLPVSVLLVLSIRYFFVILMTVTFPFTVLLYSFSPTNKIGKKMLRISFTWLFLPVFDAFILGAASISFYVSASEALKLFISLTGFLLLILSPFIFARIADFFTDAQIISSIRHGFSERIDRFIEE